MSVIDNDSVSALPITVRKIFTDHRNAYKLVPDRNCSRSHSERSLDAGGYLVTFQRKNPNEQPYTVHVDDGYLEGREIAEDDLAEIIELTIDELERPRREAFLLGKVRKTYPPDTRFLNDDDDDMDYPDDLIYDRATITCRKVEEGEKISPSMWWG